jgi:hypothetical protein
VRWTQAAGAVVALTLLPGCAAWIGFRHPVTARHDVARRPARSYYCYDCHGYRYFDPYYDWCAGYGFRYAWDRHPETVRVYRQRYVRIKEQNPTYGRYRYRTDYRETRRYKQPRDYDLWRRSAGSSRPLKADDSKVQEKVRPKPGTKKQKNERSVRERRPAERPRDARPADGRRPGPPGGA